MLKYRNIIFCLFITSFLLSQKDEIELSVQQGHAEGINNICISPSKKYFVTTGSDKKVVVWDYKLGTQIGFLYLKNHISNITFLKNDSLVYCETYSKNKSVEYFQLNLNTLTTKNVEINKENFKSKIYVFTKGNHYYVDGPKLIRVNQLTNKRKVVTSDYYDQPFHSLSFSKKYDLLFASCEDGFIYVFDLDLNLIKQLNVHLSGVTHTALPKDENELISVSSDRSIVKWTLPELEFADRYTGKSYATFGLSSDKNHENILFGNEVGFVKTLNVKDSRMKIKSTRESIYPILFTESISDSTHAFAGESNGIYFKNKQGETIEKINNLKLNLARLDYIVFVKLLGLYRDPFSKIEFLDHQPDDDIMLVYASNKTRFPGYFKLINTNTFKSSKRLFIKGITEKPTLSHLNSNSFVTSGAEKEIMHWVYKPKKLNKIKYKTITIGAPFSHFCKWDEEHLLVNSNVGLLLLNVMNHKTTALNIDSFNKVEYLDNHIAVGTSSDNNQFKVIQKKGNEIITSNWFKGHKDSITSFTFDKNKSYIYSSSLDGTIRVWDTKKEALLITIIPVGVDECIYVTPDNYYMTTGKTLESFGFKKGGSFFLPEQFDPFFNRPDIVMERLGYADPLLIDAFYKAYQKRLAKMNFTESMLKKDFHIPNLSIENKSTINNSSDTSEVMLKIKMNDDKYTLDRYNVWVNDVPIYGQNGVSLRGLSQNNYTSTAKITLSEGLNSIKVSCTNSSGAESYKESLRIRYNPIQLKEPTVYFVGIGVDEYAESDQNLSYCKKDIIGLTKKLKSKYDDQLVIDTLFDKSFSIENLNKIKTKLLNTDIEDKIIISYSGHGLLSENFDYYLGAYNVDFHSPENGGIAYEKLEWLLDSIPARKKLMLLDACHSGEVDKSELTMVTDEGEKTGAKGAIRVYKYDPVIGMKNSFELMQELFANLNKGTGATVISAAAGNQFAYEKGELDNGVFTYSILELLTAKENVSISELKEYVGSRVSELTNGVQQPTSRTENIANDWRFW